MDDEHGHGEFASEKLIVKRRGISEEDTATSRHVINEALPGSFSEMKIQSAGHFGQNAEASREFEVVGLAKDARYLTYNLDQPSGPFFFLPEAQADYTKSLGSLFLHDIVVLIRPGAGLSIAYNPAVTITAIVALGCRRCLQLSSQLFEPA